MGLDQYAEFRKEPTKTFYWRKHDALQEYMERLWEERTGRPASTLNCQDLHLDEEDIEDLRKAILSGFKDCRSDGDGHQYQERLRRSFRRMTVEEYREDDLRFCDEAVKAIERGETVIYSCWW